MTIQEAAVKVAERIEGQLGAIRAASGNGNPIVTPGGQPVAFKAPHPADITISLLQANSVLLQFMNAIAGAISGGFVLTDAEAGRIADLVAARLGKGSAEAEAGGALQVK